MKENKCVYDFEICAEYEELKLTLHTINTCGYDLISVTQDARGFYTVFFRLPSYECGRCMMCNGVDRGITSNFRR